MHALVRDIHKMTDGERAACHDLWQRVFPPAPDHVPDPNIADPRIACVMLFNENQELVASCNWIDRVITVNDEPQRIAGLACVAVEEAHRGQGHGTHLVRAAIEAARARGYDFGVLFCGPRRRAFYERLGWRLLTGEISVAHHGTDQPVQQGDLVMAIPLTPAATEQLAPWITARIHVGLGQW